MLQITRPSKFTRVLATWLLASILNGVVLGPAIGILIGFAIAIAFGRNASRTPHEARRRQVVDSEVAD
jgi:hypothetical protein